MGRMQLRAEERRWRRGDFLTVTGAILLGAALAWIVLSVQGLRNELQTANQARDALASQVEHLGHTPVAGPPGSRGEPGKSVTGPRGPKGDTGEPGSPGPSGSPGRPGKDGSSGTDGSPGPSGSPGPTGSPGSAGAQGPVGPEGPAGPAGKDGADGKDGTDGRDGKPPAGWTFQYGGATYTCSPVDNFDPDDPHYTCTSSDPGNGNSGGSDGGLLGLGLDPSRRQYV